LSTPGRIIDDLILNENEFCAKISETSTKKVNKRPVSQDNYSTNTKQNYFNPKQEVLQQIKNNKLENYNEISHETFLNNITNMKQKINTDSNTYNLDKISE